MKSRINILDMITTIILLWYINPMSMDFYNWNYFAVLAFIWVVAAAIENSKALIESIINLPIMCYCLFLSVLLIYSSVGHSPFYFQSLSVPFAYVVGFYYIKHRSRENLRTVLAFGSIYIFIITINTMLKLYTNPNISRYLAGGNSEITRELATPFTGGFTFVYATLLLSINAFSIFLTSNKGKSKAYKVFNIVQLLLGTVLILMAQYMTALILLFVGYWLVILYSPTSNKIKIFSFFAMIAILVILMFGLLPGILENIAMFFPPEGGAVQEHLLELASVVRYGKSSAGSLARVKIFRASFGLFYHSPIFGAGYSRNHQEFIDFFARYGVVGALPYFGAMFMMSRRIIGLFDKSIYRMSVIIPYIIFALYLFLDTATDGLFYIVLFFLIAAPAIIIDKPAVMQNNKGQ